jgi:hypothetical protein
MQLSKLRVYLGSEDQTPVLVLEDGDERILIRTAGGDGQWLRDATARLIIGALDLKAAVEMAQAVPQ